MNASRIRERRIVIAGDGIAAVAAAMRWIEAGYRPYLLVPPSIAGPALEAVPVAASRLFDACGLGDALAAAGARRLEEFVLRRLRCRAEVIGADYDVVDRAALARVARAIASASGARIVTVESLPGLEIRDDGVRIASAGDFLAAIDATGLAGVWSGPRRRSGPTLVADVYDATPIRRSGVPRAVGEVCVGADFWAYSFATARRATIGVIAPSGAPAAFVRAKAKRRLSVDLAVLERTRRRAAFASAAREPISAFRASVGDAAVAHNPIAGEGIRFALASSVAAVAALRTVLERRSDHDVAVDYYRRFVDDEFASHSRAVARGFIVDAEDEGARLESTARLFWCARTAVAGVQRDGYVVPETVVVARGGRHYRWVGAADLLDLRAVVGRGTYLPDLVDALGVRGVAREESFALLAWCVRRGILGTCRTRGG